MSFIGDIGAALIQGDATKDAAETQANAAGNATAAGQRQFSQLRADQAPYREAGYGALQQINALLGITPVSANGGMSMREQIRERMLPNYIGNYGGNGINDAALDAAVDAEMARLGVAANAPAASPAAPAAPTPVNALAALRSQPGYQFGLDQGLQALERSAAARGGLYSGKAMKAAQQFGQNYADTRLGETYNRLASVAGLGQTATGNTGAAGMMFGQMAGNNALGAGNAMAAAGMARGNLWGNALSSLGAYGERNGWFGGGGVRSPSQGFQNADWWRGGDGWEGE